MPRNSHADFYWKDWWSDKDLELCSLAAQGLWMRMLCICAEAGPVGYLLMHGKAVSNAELAELVGKPTEMVSELVAELAKRHVFSRNRAGVIYSRRMVREEKRKRAVTENGKLGGNPNIARGTVPKEQRVRRFRRSDSPAKTQRIFDKSGGRCHWCRTEVVGTRSERGRNAVGLFHVGHVIAVKDGGTNDETNLVAVCAKCNHERAKIIQPPTSDHAPTPTDISADHKPRARASTFTTKSTKSTKTTESTTATGPPGNAAEQICAALGVVLTESPARVTWPGLITQMIESGLDLDKDILPACIVAKGRGIANLEWVRKRAEAKRSERQSTEGNAGDVKSPTKDYWLTHKEIRKHRLDWLQCYALDGTWEKNELPNGVWGDAFNVGPPPHNSRTLITDDLLDLVPKARDRRDLARSR